MDDILYRVIRETSTKESKMKVVKSSNVRGCVVSVVDAGKGHKEYFANSKRYWISFNDGKAIYRSNSLAYITNKFNEIVG